MKGGRSNAVNSVKPIKLRKCSKLSSNDVLFMNGMVLSMSPTIICIITYEEVVRYGA